MNIRNSKKIRQYFVESNLKNLFEGEQKTIQTTHQVPKQLMSDVETEQIQKVIALKNKQFKFDCGISMARIREDINTKFGLKWHYDNNSDVESFIDSVRSFIETAGYELSDKDIIRLTKEYQKLG